MSSIPKRTLGKTGVDVTIMGLGGEGVLRTYNHERESYDLINSAIDLGINYCESARAYSGSESYYGLALGERRREVFLTSKSHARDKAGAEQHLAETLHNMKTDWLDLWQVHDVRTEEDLAMIFGAGGAIEAFHEAKALGRVRFVGVTGHHDPAILAKALDMYDFDTVLMPVNPAEPAYASFLEQVAPKARSLNMGIVGMKVYFRGFAQRVPWYNGMRPFFDFALSRDISLAVIGCDSVEQLEENVRFAKDFQSMDSDAMNELIAKMAPYARALMYYKP